jgi:uncharacterized SAM-binding protein YcdF (DUF218 family)/lysophospholipase L1-like esterase
MSSGRFRLSTAAAFVRRHSFLCGAVFACAALLGLRELFNDTTVPDRLVSPLLIPDTDAQKADAIVVLGAGVTGPCAPNTNSVQRVLHAARAWREGWAPIVIFTGHAGTNNDPCRVADAMAKLAREIGVPATAVFTERFSMSTRENAELTAPLLRWLGVQRVLVVTDRLHMRRASGVFAAQGFDVERRSVPVYDGHTNNTAMLIAGTRELAAVGYYELRGWLDSARPGTPAGAARPVATSTPGSHMRITNPSGPIVLLGASYADGWDIDRIDDATVINKGVAGQTSVQMLDRFERDVSTAQPRAVIIWGFINDIFGADDTAAARERARASYLRMIELARERGIEPIVATEITARPPASWTNALASIIGAIRGKESYQARINRDVMETNRWLVDLARREGLLLLDFQSTLAEGGGMRRAEFTQADGSHITPAGYEALTVYARPILEAHFARSAS